MAAYYSGEGASTPGAGGNLGGLMAGSPGYRLSEDEINKRTYEHFMRNDPYGQRIREKGKQFQQNFNRFPLQAQAMPGMAAGQAMGNAGALGGEMMMGPRFGPRPLNFDVNAVDDRVESIGGSANIQIDPNQTLRLGGNFNPAYTDPMGMQNPQGFSVYGEYATPGIGINVNYRNTGRGRGMQGMPGMGGPGGFPGEIQAGFRGKF